MHLLNEHDSFLGNLLKAWRYLISGQFDRICFAFKEKALRRFYRYEKVYLLEKQKNFRNVNGNDVINSSIDFQFRLAQKADLPACSELMGISVEESYRRYDAGDFCFGAFKNANVISELWVHQGPFYVKGIGYYEKSIQDIGYLYNAVTDPLFRNKGLNKSLIYLACRILFEKGSSKLIVIVNHKNRVALDIWLRTGFKTTKIVSYLAILGVKCTTIENIVSRHASRRMFLRIPKDVYAI
jgi:ribosomal protein S18 acetylase RimI-like enzyme